MKRFAMLTIVLMLFVTTALADTATVTGDVLNLREVPQGKVLTTVRRGEILTIISGPDRNNYYQVKYNGNYYYAYGDYLNIRKDSSSQTETQSVVFQSTTKTRKSTPKTVETKIKYCFIGPDECECECKDIMFVKAKNRLALRLHADTKSARLGWLPHGMPVMILNKTIKNGFVKVQTLDGLIGFAYASYLSADKIEDVTYSYGTCENYGCCDGLHECWYDVSWYVSK